MSWSVMAPADSSQMPSRPGMALGKNPWETSMDGEDGIHPGEAPGFYLGLGSGY